MEKSMEISQKSKNRTTISSVQLLGCVLLFATPWIAAHHASLSITNSRSLLKLMCIKSVMSSSHLILCCPLLLLPPIPPSIRVSSNKSTLGMRWPKNYRSFSFSISPSDEHPGLISFKMDWLLLLNCWYSLPSCVKLPYCQVSPLEPRTGLCSSWLLRHLPLSLHVAHSGKCWGGIEGQGRSLRRSREGKEGTVHTGPCVPNFWNQSPKQGGHWGLWS